jgi:hypothetical protein
VSLAGPRDRARPLRAASSGGWTARSPHSMALRQAAAAAAKVPGRCCPRSTAAPENRGSARAGAGSAEERAGLSWSAAGGSTTAAAALSSAAGIRMAIGTARLWIICWPTSRKVCARSRSMVRLNENQVPQNTPITSANSMMVSPWTARMRPRRDSLWPLASVAFIANPSRPGWANPGAVRAARARRPVPCPPPTLGPRAATGRLATGRSQLSGTGRVGRCRAGCQPRSAVLRPG